VIFEFISGYSMVCFREGRALVLKAVLEN